MEIAPMWKLETRVKMSSHRFLRRGVYGAINEVKMCFSTPCPFWSIVKNFLVRFWSEKYLIPIISIALIFVMLLNKGRKLAFNPTPGYSCMVHTIRFITEERIYSEPQRFIILRNPLPGKIAKARDNHLVHCIRRMKVKVLMIRIFNWKKLRRKAIGTFEVNWMHKAWEHHLFLYILVMDIGWGHVNPYGQKQIYNMPKTICVTETEAVAELEQYIHHFRTNDIPKSNAPVWKELSKNCCNKKWSALSWYTNVNENRRGILTAARQNKNIEVPPQMPDASINETNGDTSREEMIGDEADSELEEHVTTFKLTLEPEIWNIIKPIESNEKRTQNTLKPGVWSNIVADLFQQEYRLPCAFGLKRADVCVSSNRKHFLKITGRCIDKSCANPFVGIADNEPCSITGKVELVIKTRDTYGTKHAPVTRPCNGAKRITVGKRALDQGSYNTRNEMIRKTTRRGDPVAPTVPSLDVVRHCKQDFIREDNGLKDQKGKSAIHVIEELQWQKPYYGTITHVSSCPFIVIYASNAQIAAYKQYCRINRGRAVITIDSTGSLVKKLDRPGGLKSGHIFLFSVVINFSNTILSVCQMISECQEWESVVQMLGSFVRRTAVKPKRCISDASKTLFLAESLAFNGCTTSQYMEKLFVAVKTKTLTRTTMETFLFSDVAHFIHAATKWKIFQNLQLPAVKDFFIRALAMMVDCQQLEDFKKLFFLTCLVALQSHEDSGVRSPFAATVQDARLKLQNFMAIRPLDENGFAHFKEMQKLEDFDPDISVEEENESPQLTAFIDSIIASAQSVITEGNNLNAYCLPGLIKDLRRVGREFLLWTAVGNPFYMGHHSSSSSEGHFSILKSKVFKQYGLPQRADNFLIIHNRALLGEQLNFDSNLKHFLNQDQHIPSPLVKVFPSKEKNCTADTSPQSKINQEQGDFQDDILDSTEPMFQSRKIIPEDYPDRQPSKKRKTAAEEHLIEEKLSKGGVIFSDSSDEDEHLYREDWRGKGAPYHFLNTEKHEKSDVGISDETERPEGRRDAKAYGSGISADFREVKLGESDVMGNTIPQDSLGIDSELLAENLSMFTSSKLQEFPEVEVSSCDFHAGTVINSTTADEEVIDEELMEENFHRVLSDHDYTTCNIIPAKSSTEMKKSQAKYFRISPEVQYCDPTVKKAKVKPHLLPHAMKCSAVLIDAKSYDLENTCAFDSLIQILYTAALDDGSYRKFLEVSISPLAKFIMNFMLKGACTEIYAQRVRLLIPLFPPKPQGASSLVSVINAHGNPCLSWRSLMSEDPSIMRNINCPNPNCEAEKQRKVSTWFPDIQLVKHYGFKNLQNALRYHQNLWNVRCPCGALRCEEQISNFHILLELDMRVATTDPAKKCKLHDIPEILTFNREYRLAGIIAYDVGTDHYTAYCCRRPGMTGSVSSCWEHHNGLASKVVSVRGNPQIQPECAIYIMAPDRR